MITALSPRQLEALWWIAQGKTYAQITLIMQVKLSSVKHHLNQVRVKMDVTNLSHAVYIACTTGLFVDVPPSAAKIRTHAPPRLPAGYHRFFSDVDSNHRSGA